MSRLTITLSEARYRALEEASAQRDKTIGHLIDESLDWLAGVLTRRDAVEEIALPMAASQRRGAYPSESESLGQCPPG